MTALIAACLGGGVTYLALRPALKQSTQTRQMAAQAARALGDRAYDQSDWTGAVRFYSQAITSGGDNPDVRTDLGTAYRGLRQPQNALAQYAAAQKQDPRHENSLFNQGLVYAADLGDEPRAAAVWRQYLARFPQGGHVAQAQQFIAQIQASPPAVTPTQPDLP